MNIAIAQKVAKRLRSLQAAKPLKDADDPEITRRIPV